MSTLDEHKIKAVCKALSIIACLDVDEERGTLDAAGKECLAEAMVSVAVCDGATVLQAWRTWQRSGSVKFDPRGRRVTKLQTPVPRHRVDMR